MFQSIHNANSAPFTHAGIPVGQMRGADDVNRNTAATHPYRDPRPLDLLASEPMVSKRLAPLGIGGRCSGQRGRRPLSGRVSLERLPALRPKDGPAVTVGPWAVN